MIVAAEKEGCDLLFVDVDREGGRDIDRTQLDTIYSAMEVGSISHIFVRRLKDITEDIADLMEFHRTAADHGVSIRIVNVESDESEMETEDAWDGGMGC
jgi:DNA invertase Pin-like site-specific DNA recombinase